MQIADKHDSLAISILLCLKWLVILILGFSGLRIVNKKRRRLIPVILLGSRVPNKKS